MDLPYGQKKSPSFRAVKKVTLSIARYDDLVFDGFQNILIYHDVQISVCFTVKFEVEPRHLIGSVGMCKVVLGRASVGFQDVKCGVSLESRSTALVSYVKNVVIFILEIILIIESRRRFNHVRLS